MNDFKFLVFTLLLSTHIVDASEIDYVLSGQQAVFKLEKTGECTQCDLSGQNLTRAFSVLNKKNKAINVAGSDLSASIIIGCDLQGANLQDTILDSTLLLNVAVQGANFTGARMQRMRLKTIESVTKYAYESHHPNQKFYTVK